MPGRLEHRLRDPRTAGDTVTPHKYPIFNTLIDIFHFNLHKEQKHGSK